MVRSNQQNINRLVDSEISSSSKRNDDDDWGTVMKIYQLLKKFPEGIDKLKFSQEIIQLSYDRLFTALQQQSKISAPQGPMQLPTCAGEAWAYPAGSSVPRQGTPNIQGLYRHATGYNYQPTFSQQAPYQSFTRHAPMDPYQPQRNTPSSMDPYYSYRLNFTTEANYGSQSSSNIPTAEQPLPAPLSSSYEPGRYGYSTGTTPAASQGSPAAIPSAGGMEGETGQETIVLDPPISSSM